MKKAILTIVAVLIFAGPAFAGKYTINAAGTGFENENWSHGAIVDAPFLFRVTEKVFVGAEVNKRLSDTSSSEGWEVWGKVTYAGTIFSLYKDVTGKE